MIIQTNLLILILAALLSFTLQSPCKISVHCSCGSTGDNITLICVEETNIDNLCHEWPGCVVCSKGQDCQECSGESSCTGAKLAGKPRQKRQEATNFARNKLSCIDPGFISKGIRKDMDGMESDRYIRRKYKEKEFVVFSCESENFMIEGSAVLTCSNGKWSAPRPRCVPRTAKRPPPCLCVNGESCDENGKCICPAGRPGKLCEPKKLRCNDPGFISNGIRRDMNDTESDHSGRLKYEYGESVVFSCKSQEFMIEGSSVLTCTGGSWSAPRPRCVRFTVDCRGDSGCPSDQACMSRRCVNLCAVQNPCGRNADCRPTQHRPHCYCKPGFAGNATDYCEKEKEIAYCRNPGEISNGMREYYPPNNKNHDDTSEKHLDDPKYPQGGRLEYGCDHGYELEGEEELHCESSGSWSSNPPSCRIDDGPKFCSYPGPISNGQVSYIPAPSEKSREAMPILGEEEFPQGVTLQYACNMGYTINGVESLTCESTGIWSHNPPSCKYMMYCENRGPIENGKVTHIFPEMPGPAATDRRRVVPEGTILRYECEDGYDLSGQSNVTCLNTSFWSAAPPICKTECGLSTARSTRRITNGVETLPGDWPWVVAIAVEKENGYKEKVCGGAVWSSGVVVTAAHCLTVADTFTLYFGKLHLNDKGDDADVQIRTSTQVILHPNYNNFTYEFDIGLVKFKPRIKFSNRTLPICPPTVQSTVRNLRTGENGYVTGWGETEKQVQASSLLLAVLPYQTNEACMEAYRSQNLSFSINQNMFCAGFEDAQQSTCTGDSGSPLVFYDSHWMRYNLEGIVSFGVLGQCGRPKRYTVFTRVFPFLPWITINVYEEK